ncbi:hypothetical protein ABZ499_08280 [Streptomyces sp. NPDC019990]|uniref:hypothetical protein n=1 Tax=Streptomyces sp. NPDC019990 TaxID=3154693 RepID=UPI0033F343CA
MRNLRRRDESVPAWRAFSLGPLQTPRDDRVHRWAATAPALDHLALVRAFSRRTVGRVEAQVLRRL